MHFLMKMNRITLKKKKTDIMKKIIWENRLGIKFDIEIGDYLEICEILPDTENSNIDCSINSYEGWKNHIIDIVSHCEYSELLELSKYLRLCSRKCQYAVHVLYIVMYPIMVAIFAGLVVFMLTMANEFIYGFMVAIIGIALFIIVLWVWLKKTQKNE